MILIYDTVALENDIVIVELIYLLIKNVLNKEEIEMIMGS